MSFLAPLFALGVLAVAGPILFHLIRRTTREKTPFSTLMFLEPSPPRITKRSRLENVGLLLLRCLALALLALAFARPFLQRVLPGPPPGSGQRIVILADTSASMRRENLWAEARAKIEERVRTAHPTDEIALLTFDREMHTVMSFEEWRKTAPDERAAATTQRLAAITPRWNATRLDAALLHSIEALDQAGQSLQGKREIVVVSDMQEGAQLDGLQGYQWPRGISVTIDPVSARAQENAAAQWLSESEESDKPGEEVPLRVRVNNAAESKHEQFQLRWQGAPEGTLPIDAYVPAGQARIVRITKPPAGATALALSGDDTPFDNTLSILAPQPAQLPVLFVGPDADEDPHGSLYYLRRAFPKTAHQNVEILAHRDGSAVPAYQLQQAQLLVLGETTASAPLASARQFARDGKIVVLPLTSATSATTLGQTLEMPTLSAPEATVKDYALLAQIDFRHPLFAAFADPRFSDFAKIHWWKYRRLDASALPGAQTLAQFDSGDPAIVQVPLGKGSVVVFTSSWRLADSQLALSSKFVPLLQALLEQSSSLPPQKAQYFVGDDVPLPTGPQPITVRKPDGKELAVAPGAKFSDTDQPGVYAVSPGTQRFVVNLSPDESRLAPFSTERLIALGVPLHTVHETAAEVARREGQAQAVEIENQQKLWRWLLVAALGVLLLETLFAGKLSRPASGSTTAST
ncbi:MAG: BatA domain-containing protein [Chthoniobacter sp.]|uniref:vWA domain-containing protein n=1 Tax=Chthoniobacter sp. TaxID=2510640 RepID=UPI0032A9F339